jgi:hypothetical protein
MYEHISVPSSEFPLRRTSEPTPESPRASTEVYVTAKRIQETISETSKGKMTQSKNVFTIVNPNPTQQQMRKHYKGKNNIFHVRKGSHKEKRT